MRGCEMGKLRVAPCMPMCVFWDAVENYSTVYISLSTCSSVPLGQAGLRCYWGPWEKAQLGLQLVKGSAERRSKNQNLLHWSMTTENDKFETDALQMSCLPAKWPLRDSALSRFCQEEGFENLSFIGVEHSCSSWASYISSPYIPQ